MLLLTSVIAQAEGLTTSIPDGAVLGPEARTVTIGFKTSNSWKVICGYANGRFDKLSGKGNGTVTLTLDANQRSDVAYYHLIGIFDNSTKRMIGGLQFIQLPAQMLQQINARCHCGADRDLMFMPDAYSGSSFYRRVAVPLNPQLDSAYAQRHAVVSNNSSIWCFNCDAEIEGLFIMGDVYETSDANFSYQNHSMSGGVCTACGYGTKKPEPVQIPATSIALSAKSLQMSVNTTAQLTATVTPGNSTSVIRWRSSSPDVISVNQAGTLSAKAEGQAAISVETSNGLRAECVVSVIDPSAMNPASYALYTTKTANVPAISNGFRYSVVSMIIPKKGTAVLAKPEGNGLARVIEIDFAQCKTPVYVDVTKLTKHEAHSFRGGNPATRYTPLDDKTHKKSTVVSKKYCTLCGHVESEFQELEEIDQAHSFNKRGECTLCFIKLGEYTIEFTSGVTEEPVHFDFPYRDSFFSESSLITNNHLARASMALAANAYVSPDDGGDKLLEAMGFRIVHRGNYKETGSEFDNNFVAFRIATKEIEVNNTKYELFGVFVRGTPGHSFEWYSNFDIGTGQTHRGFTLSARNVIDTLSSKLNQSTSNLPKKIWITGHSRGAAIANIVANQFSEDSRVDARNIYTYTFACPAVSRNAVSNSIIKNYNNPGDFVANVPLAEWGYGRHGYTFNFPLSLAAKFEAKYKALWSAKYEGNYQSKYVPTWDIYSLVREPPHENSAKGRALHTTGGFIGGKATLDEVKAAWSGIVGNNIEHLDNTFKIITYVMQNKDMGIPYSHGQEFYLAWMDLVAGEFK